MTRSAQKDVWGLKLQDELTENASPSTRTSRRSRTASAPNNMALIRRSDELTVKVGDSVAIDAEYADDSDSCLMGIIVAIDFDVTDQFRVEIMWYVTADELSVSIDNVNEKELFLSLMRETLPVCAIDKAVQVHNVAKSGGLFCTRAVVTEGSKGDDEKVVNIGLQEVLQRLTHGKKEALDYVYSVAFPQEKGQAGTPKKGDTLRQTTSPKKSSAVNTPKATPKKKEAHPKASPAKRVKYEDEESEDEEDEDEVVEVEDYFSDGSDESSGDDEDSDSSIDVEEEDDVEYGKQAKSKRKTAKVTQQTQPRKRRYRKKSKTGEVDEAEEQEKAAYNASLEFMRRVYGTQRVLIKSSLSAPDFGALNDQAHKPGPKKKKSKTGFEDYESLDTDSAAFKELKKRLHTATKLASLPCREDEFTSLYLSIENSIREQTGCCLYVSGTPGIGKTATIKEVMTQMVELNQLGEIPDFQYVEINALKLVTPSYAYTTLWKKISGIQVSPAAAALFLETYFKEKSDKKKPIVIMVDELDQLASKTQSVMYNFFNWPTYTDSKLIVLAVANTMDLPERVLSNKISSRLGLKRIQFLGYTHEQLSQIIEHRLDLLTTQHKYKVVVEPDAIKFASRKVASVSGDARKALQICRRAVEMAELEYRLKKQSGEENRFSVKIPHIAAAINETVNSPIAQYISTLSFGSKLILCGVVLRTKRTGKAENPLGDIIEEINGLLRMAAAKDLLFLSDRKNPVSMSDALLEGNLYDSEPTGQLYSRGGMRLEQFALLFNELVENGILNCQDIKSEQYRLTSLNSSQEEMMTLLRNDPLISTFL